MSPFSPTRRYGAQKPYVEKRVVRVCINISHRERWKRIRTPSIVVKSGVRTHMNSPQFIWVLSPAAHTFNEAHVSELQKLIRRTTTRSSNKKARCYFTLGFRRASTNCGLLFHIISIRRQSTLLSTAGAIGSGNQPQLLIDSLTLLIDIA
eukprot:SAG31_NODE_4281_length_3382_cov_3.978373_3_plen_150_part_00